MPDELLRPLLHYTTFTQRSYGHHPEILCLEHDNYISIMTVFLATYLINFTYFYTGIS